MRHIFIAAVCACAIASPRPIGGWRQADAAPSRPSTVNCTWKTFQQKIDHFGDAAGTFPQRYCVYSKWWKTAAHGGFTTRSTPNATADAAVPPGPILFYTGNESPVEEYINNTGLMWELGESLGALLVFAEHRYEPLSHPALCGQSTQKCFAYCTTAQALADWAALLSELRGQHGARAPAVAFGGSYGGMLSGWFRMKYPDVIDGAIAASAPIWQLADTVRRDTLDMQAVAIARGVSAAGGATDQCRDNLRAAWPLLQQVGRSPAGRLLLSESVGACEALRTADDLIQWAQRPYFYMAEGNYPFPSSYITFSVGPGLNPLPAWPMRTACAAGLNEDFGIRLEGSPADVKYNVSLGDVHVAVDWDAATGNGKELTAGQIRASGALELAAAVSRAAAVWYNVTHDKPCFDISSYGDDDAATGGGGDDDGSALATGSGADPALAPAPAAAAAAAAAASAAATAAAAAIAAPGGRTCPACPPCDDCPPCPVSYCDWEDTTPCSYSAPLPKTFSWEGICCNDALSQIDVRGVGRDIFWPPGPPARNYTVESVVGPRGLSPGGCQAEYAAMGLRGAPLVGDRWSGWMSAYYGGRNVSHHRNIVWSNGALDPWSGQGVYPEGGGPEQGKPMVQNISADGSQIALVLDLGAHHLDLMFSDPRNPPCFHEARKVEEAMIRQWCQEAYDALEL